MSELIDRLREIMPDTPKSEPQSGNLRIQVYPIRYAADTFCHALGGNIPANEDELLAFTARPLTEKDGPQ